MAMRQRALELAADTVRSSASAAASAAAGQGQQPSVTQLRTETIETARAYFEYMTEVATPRERVDLQSPRRASEALRQAQSGDTVMVSDLVNVPWEVGAALALVGITRAADLGKITHEKLQHDVGLTPAEIVALQRGLSPHGLRIGDNGIRHGTAQIRQATGAG